MMYRHILLCSTLSLSSFVVFAGYEAPTLGLFKPVITLRWQESGEEKTFNVRRQEAEFIKKYIVPLVTKLSGCQLSGQKWASCTSFIGAVGAAGFSWYAGISDKISNMLQQNGFEYVSWLSGIAPVLVGGLAYFILKPLLKRGYTLLFLANERARWRRQIMFEIEMMKGSSWELIKNLVYAIRNLKNVVRIRFLRLKHALNETLVQNGCSDEIKCALFGFDNPADCTEEFVCVMQRLLAINTANLILNPQRELTSFALDVCNNA